MHRRSERRQHGAPKGDWPDGRLAGTTWGSPTREIIIRAENTKDRENRIIPISGRLRQVLEIRKRKKKALQRRLDPSARPRREDHEDEGWPDASGSQGRARDRSRDRRDRRGSRYRMPMRATLPRCNTHCRKPRSTSMPSRRLLTRRSPSSTRSWRTRAITVGPACSIWSGRCGPAVIGFPARIVLLRNRSWAVSTTSTGSKRLRREFVRTTGSRSANDLLLASRGKK
jgi:hypothetical protein